jgi:hypothetical protein
LHLFKWKENNVEIPLSSDFKKANGLDDDYAFFIKVLPDVESISNDVNRKRTYLTVRMSVVLNIIESNINERSLFFTNFDILTDYLQNFGLIFKLMPFTTKGTDFETNFNAVETLFKKENFINYKTVLTTDQPRISSILFRYHLYCWLPLIKHYINYDNKEKITLLLNFMKNDLTVGNGHDFTIEEWITQLNLDDTFLE